VALVGLPAAQAQSLVSTACGPTWTEQTVAGIGRLVDVTALSPTDAWAVGSGEGISDKPAAAHWDGSAWNLVHLPQPAHSDAADIRAISASGPDDVWAVGQYRHGLWFSFSEHWDGTSWTTVTTPSVPHNTMNLLNDVTAIAPDDAWAVGEHNLQGHLGDEHPDVEHWDGVSWTKVTVPTRPDSVALQVSASGPDDVSVLLYDHNVKPYVDRWNGTTWTLTRTDSHDKPANPIPSAIEALSPSDAWLAGSRMGNLPTQASPIAEHWDGAAWTRVHVPDANRADLPSGLAAVATNDVWMTGTRQLGAPGSTNSQAESWNWNGASWSFVSIPASHPGAALAAADALPTGEVWTVGTWFDDNGDTHGLIYQRCDA
jgi:hypothetical protein